MKADFWQRIKYFEPWEFGIPIHPEELREREARDNMNPVLIFKLDALREMVKGPIIIHAGFATAGHSPMSQHYLGNAADFHIEGLSLLEMYLAAERFHFTGLGLYPFWGNPGLHGDMRSLPFDQPGARWWRDAQSRYLPLTASVLLSLGQLGVESSQLGVKLRTPNSELPTPGEAI